ncbi:MAG: AAA family ATPase [Nitrosopumilus sp.]
MENKSKNGFTGYVVEIKKVGSNYRALDINEKDITSDIPRISRKKAYEAKMALAEFKTSTGKSLWKMIEMNEFSSQTKSMNPKVDKQDTEEKSDHDALKDLIHKDSVALRPIGLVMEDLQWKHLIRSTYRGKNIMMTGATGCGKTFAVQCLIKALDRPSFYFNLGATQDPRATLIGNTHFNKENGTYFSQSTFVKAIQVENSIILLDELSRAHPEAGNILMSVLDYGQRYLRLDEQDGAPVIKVAHGVTFVATANIGNEYTSTRVMDRALKDRFTIIEMKLLNKEQEEGLLKYQFPYADDYSLESIAAIADHTRKEMKSEDSKISDMISTRASVEMAELIYDGFTLAEAAEVVIYPYFSDDGGTNSERTYIQQLVQKYIKDENSEDQYDNKEVTNDLEYKDVDDS